MSYRMLKSGDPGNYGDAGCKQKVLIKTGERKMK